MSASDRDQAVHESAGSNLLHVGRHDDGSPMAELSTSEKIKEREKE